MLFCLLAFSQMKEKEIGKTLVRALLFSWLISSALCVAGIIVFQISNAPPADLERPGMDCFPGLPYGIAVGVTIFYLLVSLFSFFNLNKKIRNNSLLSGAFFLLPSIILQAAVFIGMGKDLSVEDMVFFLLIFLSYFIPWSFFFISFRRKLKMEVD